MVKELFRTQEELKWVAYSHKQIRRNAFCLKTLKNTYFSFLLLGDISLMSYPIKM